MTKKQFKSMIFILSVALFLTGCWDYEDIEKKSIVFSVGVDAVGDEIEFSGEIANITVLISGEGNKKAPSNIFIFTSRGIDFEQARLDINRQLAYPTFLGATRVVIFGEEFAKKGIESYLNRINKSYDYRKTVSPVISKGRPRDLLEIKPKNAISIGFEIENILNSLKKNGTTLDITVGDLISNVEIKTTGYLMPYMEGKNNTVQYSGLAVMKDSKLIGVIDVQDTDGILYVLSKNPTFIESVKSYKKDKNVYSFETHIKKRDIKVKYMEDQVYIDIHLDINAVLSYQYYIAPISKEEITWMEKMLSTKIKNDIVNNIHRSQKEFRCDYFQFAKYFRASYPTVYEQIDWEKKYPAAVVNVTVETTMINKNLADPNAKKKYGGE